MVFRPRNTHDINLDGNTLYALETCMERKRNISLDKRYEIK